MKLKKERFAEGVLLFITMIWGSSYVIANIALNAGLSPLFILMCRFFMAALVMWIVYHKRLINNLHLKNIKLGIILGIIFLMAFYLQMLGLKYSTPSNNAIITSANVVLVPFICWLVAKFRPAPINFVSCSISLVGIAVISVDLSSGFSLHLGDSFSFLSAVMFAIQIVAVGEMSKRSEYITLVFTEFITATIIAMILYFLTEHDLQAFTNQAGWLPILYLGVVCTFVCFFLQAWALRGVESSRGAVIMSTESLFGASLSIIVGIDSFNWRIVVGGLALFFAVILPEIQFFQKNLHPSLKTNAYDNRY